MELVLPAKATDKDNLYVRISKNDVPAALTYLKEVYGRFDNENKVDYHFLDQNFAEQYQTEQKQSNLILIFTVLGICIACLGLFGLVTFTAKQRVKEIGIRKVLGASVANIVNLLNKDILKLVLIAAIVASPVAWYAVNKWLQSFAYRVNIQWWVFAVAGIIAMLIAFITISFRSIKAAMENPAKSLKTE
jgi:putative ABC transport system permease protein